jgi:hypothetical protein
MRVSLPLVALVLATGAGVPPTVDGPALPDASPMIAQERSGAVCRDRVQEVRRELGKPALDRGASPQEPLLIAAVDKRIGGCSVLVMRNDTSDIRPLPEAGEHRLMPSR